MPEPRPAAYDVLGTCGSCGACLPLACSSGSENKPHPNGSHPPYDYEKCTACICHCGVPPKSLLDSQDRENVPHCGPLATSLPAPRQRAQAASRSGRSRTCCADKGIRVQGITVMAGFALCSRAGRIRGREGCQ